MINRNLKWLLFILLSSFCSGLLAADDDFKTEDEKVFYYIGSNIGKNLVQIQLTDDELESVLRGIRDAARGQAIALDEQEIGPKIQEMAERRMGAIAAEEKQAAQGYIDEMAAKDGAITTESGIVFRELVAGTGATPTRDSTVQAHYHGTLRDGTVFDSSVQRGEPFNAPLGSVIPCWTEAITMMQEGGKAEITCPSNLAYGDRGAGTIPGGAALTFEVELISIVE